MITASETRMRAWRKLGEGNWLVAVGAFGLYWLMGTVFSQLLTRIGFATGGIEAVPLGEVVKMLGSVPADMIPADLLKQTMPVAKPGFLAVQAVATAFMNGVITAGWAVFTISVMRNGANALQVFSGFSRFLEMGWLMLVKTARIVLWTLLLIVPGVIAFYSYRLAFFLKADHPEWSATKVLMESRRMMNDRKWSLACLDASFIGWLLLVAVTFGIATLFVSPYMGVTYAAFYEDVLDGEGA